MNGINRYLAENKDIQSVIAGIEEGMQEQLIAGLSGSARSLLVANVQQSIDRPLLFITHQLNQAEQLYDDLSGLVDESRVHLYPVNELVASEVAIASPELRSERIAALTSWLEQDSGILIAPVAALKRFLPPLSYWKEHILSIQAGEVINIEKTVTTFIQMGYERSPMVSSPGEFSVRGGIIDIYPITENHPVRIELFDEEIDSIRHFDAGTQRSLEQKDQIEILPAEELILTDEDLVAGAGRMEKALSTSLAHVTDTEAKKSLIESVSYDIERLKEAERFPEMLTHASYFYEQPTSLLDYLPENGVIVFDEMSRIQETATHLDQEEDEWYESLFLTNQMLKDSVFSFTWDEVWSRVTMQRLYLSVFLRHVPNTQPENIVNISSRPMQDFHGQMNLFQTEVERWEKSGFSVVIVSPTKKRAEKVQAILSDYEVDSTVVDEVHLPAPTPIIVVGNIRTGIELPLYKLAIITEAELFKQQKVHRARRRQKISNAERIKSYQELKVGDFVVHESHGIGKYVGIETVEVGGLHKDYMLIMYSGDDKLFVPVDQIDLVQKFVGSEGKEPRLYKLGGSEWTKVKSRVRSSVEDIADELIKLYAEREARKGYAFSPDTSLQQEFEQSFAYQETSDQLRCIEEIKVDMEKERPMDRLLCGDVGYGKTEVAIRAAFKAVSDGKQVAILVPTTILAQQHFQTMEERFQDHAINVGLLSRFRTRAQQKETLHQIERGLVDVVIGTHRLLSKDIKFRDLGLLVVDEEQRFGVKHKERIKQLKSNVDVLTLTATPIPRTLHMSMLGVRDLSVIETPPENRFPVQTYVVEYNPMFIKEAIEREISRGGQVFFLYNQVQSIERQAREISNLVPDARIGIAHGQMNEGELENVMLSFLEGEFDVLVSTTIIETGVDIPNVNTLIVHNADRMGLSQLYQLRGRVGRSNRVAYTYFTHQKDKVLTEVAEKRLQAIKEFTELGSGFKIAMRDLSIRGAGNLLGSQQHGFIDSVGFDMYSQMLQDAIEARKAGKKLDEYVTFEPELSLTLDAYIPESYISDEEQKIDMYKQFQTIRSSEDIQDLQDELMDRFGDYPPQVEHLFIVASLKRYAKDQRIESIEEFPKKIELIVEENRSQQIDGAKLFEVANGFGRNVQLGTEHQKLKVSIRWSVDDTHARYETVEKFIQQMEDVNREE